MSNILIIEDELQIAELEKDYLELSGFNVFIEKDGKSGYARALRGDISLVILDLMLPEMDGFEVCQKLREATEIPIIMVSAKQSDSDKVRGLGRGANDYMTKPFSPSELVARVKAQIERYERLVGTSGKVNNDFIIVGGLKIDITARRVFVEGEEKSFTSREFDLLRFLAQNPNRAFSKEEILREVWGLDPVGADLATVVVHIKKIREKIEKDVSTPKYIETVWAVGYRFVIE
ncbi:response regulator transcription factor [Eubacterium xylanophilum]|uniref:response regulator transcription factor n=1 Tax=Eubacterium xylanophilum TaxID=39497 RepID=UPI00047A68C5|nr:response regulator transcription factor [Eubacterium xylanophilum]MCR5796778.1 response regulator transcription factor [Eubacterium sp.]